MADLTLATYEEWSEALTRSLTARAFAHRVRMVSHPTDPGWRSPDVVWWGALDPSDAIPTGRLPLDGLAANAGFPLEPFGRLLDLERAEGRLWALPVSYGSIVLCYRPAALAAVGCTMPASGLTWDGLLDLAARLRASGITPFGAIGPYGWLAALLAWQGGADADDAAALYPYVLRVRTLAELARTPASLGPFPSEDGPALAIDDSAATAMGIAAGLHWGVASLPRVDPTRPARMPWRRSHCYIRACTPQPDAAFTLAGFIARWAGERAGHPDMEFPVYVASKAAAGAPHDTPAGLGELRTTAETADRRDWAGANPHRDRALWDALRVALEEDWDARTLAERLPAAVAAAPT